MSGGLLGSLLYGGALPGDRDIDVGLFASDRHLFDRALPGLLQKGFAIKERYDALRSAPRNLVRLQRDGLHIDVKFYVFNDGFYFTEIHKNMDRKSELVADIIDLLYFGYLRETSRLKRKVRFVSWPVEKCASNLPPRVRQRIIRRLSHRWMRMNTIYGIEIHKAELFQDFTETEYEGITIRMPAKWQCYVESEYGEDWRHADLSGRGGFNKPSHILLPKSRSEWESLDRRSQKLFTVAGLHTLV